MFWGTIHRMILIELLKIFFLALIGLTGIILLVGIISEASKNGFGPAQILACIPILLPSLLPFTVPATTLFATCMVYGRLAADNEILALKAAGIHIVHIVWPAFFLGLVTSVVTMTLYLEVIPYTACLMRNQVFADVEELLYIVLRNESCIVNPRMSWEIHVKNIQGRKLNDVIFKRKAADGTFDTIAVAKEAELRVDLTHHQILVDMRQCQVLQGENVGYVAAKIWPVEIPADFMGGNVKHGPGHLTWIELIENEKRARGDLQKVRQEIDMLHAQNINKKPGPGDDETLRHHIAERDFREGIIRGIHAEWCMRPALSFGCLCFALVGCPIGIWFSKSDYLSAFITCFLPIVIVYYPMMFCTYNLAQGGRIAPWLGIFAADAILLLTGGFLFWRLARK